MTCNSRYTARITLERARALCLKCVVEPNRRSLLAWLQPRLSAWLLPAALLALLAAPAGYCQALTPGVQAFNFDEAAGGAQATGQAQSGSNSQTSLPSEQPPSQQPAPQSEKKRLSVNPVTGLVTSPSSVDFQPLTGEERWKLYWKQNYGSIGAYFGPVFTAAVLDQTSDSPPQWGTGISGFGLRVASRTASAILQGTFQAPLAAVMHEDVRYIAARKDEGKRRVLHAILFSFVTYNDQGHITPNIANLSGYYASTAVSTFWLPSRPPVAKYTFTNGSEQIGLSVPVNILQEFWPDLTRKLFHRNEPPPGEVR